MRSFFNQRIVEVLIVIAFLMLIGIIIVPSQIRVRNESRKNACINNLRLIDSCKQQWALENNAKATDSMALTDLWEGMWCTGRAPEFDETKLPCCPSDPAKSFRTSYQIRSVAELPICLIDPKNHVLRREWTPAPTNFPASSPWTFSNPPSGGR